VTVRFFGVFDARFFVKERMLFGEALFGKAGYLIEKAA